MHLIIWFCPKSRSWLFFILKKAFGETSKALHAFSNSSTTSCTIGSSMPMLDKASNKASNGASYSNLFTMLLQLHPIKRSTPTQRSLSLVSILKVFGIKNSMIVVPKKWGEYWKWIASNNDFRRWTNNKYAQGVVAKAKCNAPTIAWHTLSLLTKL